MDLKELLGEELYNKVMEKAGDSHKIAIVSDGNWFPKEKFDQVNNDNKEMKKQLKDRDTQLNDLKGQAKGNEELQQQIEKLQEENKNTKEQYEQKIQQQAFDHSLENALSQSKARNTTAVKSLLNLDDIKFKEDQLQGLDEQLKKVKEENPFLFEAEQQESEQQKQHREPPQFSQGQHQKTGDIDPFVAGLGLKGGND
ncbi:phage scaffolding protein [Alteribacillus sp. JSM 102045]|uniref:phage scaffolding protein n=1 Tax=Alteribacillus sp. JSM 102045 TaxID=1562101 RepID=UPI0035C040ED